MPYDDSDLDSRRFYRLVSEISSILSNYTSEELRKCYIKALRQNLQFAEVFRHLSELDTRPVRFASTRDEGNTSVVQPVVPVPTVEPVVSGSLREDDRRSSEIERTTVASMRADIARIIASGRIFPSAKALVDFANRRLRLHVTYHKQSRLQIIKRILAELNDMPDDRLERIRDDLLKHARARSKSAVDSFHDDWETIIRRLSFDRS